MKFDIRWFLALPKPNLEPIFRNSEKGGPWGGGDSQIFFKKNCLSTDFDEIWYYMVFWSPKTKSDVNFPKFSKGALRRGGGKFSKKIVSQPILIRFGTRWFFGLIKRKCKYIFRNYEKGALGGVGDLPKKCIFFCLSTDFDEIWYLIAFWRL